MSSDDNLLNCIKRLHKTHAWVVRQGGVERENVRVGKEKGNSPRYAGVPTTERRKDFSPMIRAKPKSHNFTCGKQRID